MLKLLEEMIGKTFSDISCTNVFLRSVSKGNRNNSKNKQMGPNQTYKLLYRKGSHKQRKDNLQNKRNYLQMMRPTRA